MAEVVHKIDLTPDTVIILEEPSGDLAVWETGDETLVEGPEFVNATEERFQRVVQGWNGGFGDSTMSNGEASAGATPSKMTPAALKNGESSRPQTGDGCQNPSIQYHVSSRHLMLASPWFHRALTREGWTESERDADGRYCIRTSKWDSTALLILLNIMHLRNRQVPRTVSLEMLAKIAVLVDYYECTEAVELFADVWMNSLQETPVPTTLCPDLVLWLWIAWAFRLPAKFEQATFVAIKHSIGDLDTLDLPLPVTVTGAIEKARKEGVLGIRAGLRGILDDYRSIQYVCPVHGGSMSFECGSIMYGALVKGMGAAGLAIDGDSLDEISLDELCNDLRGIRSPSWYHSGSGGNYQRQHPCSLQRPIKAIVDQVEVSIKGLELEARVEARE